MSTTSIVNGEPAIIRFYEGGVKTKPMVPAGITISPDGPVNNNSLTLNIILDEKISVAGFYYFTVTIDGVESAIKNIVVGNSATITKARLVETEGTLVNKSLILTLEKIDLDSTFNLEGLVYSTTIDGPSYTFAGKYTRTMNPLILEKGSYCYNNNELIIALTNDDLSGISKLTPD